MLFKSCVFINRHKNMRTSYHTHKNNSNKMINFGPFPTKQNLPQASMFFGQITSINNLILIFIIQPIKCYKLTQIFKILMIFGLIKLT